MAPACVTCGNVLPDDGQDAMDIDAQDFSGSSGSPFSTSTHPSSATSLDHFDEFKDFHDMANAAFDGAFPVHRQPRNSKVGVLLLRFEEDNLGVINEIKPLKAVFETKYGYEPEIWDIPSEQSQRMLSDKLYDFRWKYCQDDRDPMEELPLLIVYYGGHAAKPPKGQNNCLWSSKEVSPCAQLNWTTVQSALFDAPADVLVILDCCYASSATWRAGATSAGSKETIAACGPSSLASGVGERSFTSALVSELSYQAGQSSILTGVALHGYLLHTYRLEFQPTYARSHRTSRNSISLVPVPEERPSNLGQELATALTQRKLYPSVRVLLAVHLKGNPTHELIGFLRNECALPTDVVGINIERIDRVQRPEAAFQGYSTLALVSVPIAVWHLLPDHEACRFVSLITGPNLLTENIDESSPEYNEHWPEEMYGGLQLGDSGQKSTFDNETASSLSWSRTTAGTGTTTPTFQGENPMSYGSAYEISMSDNGSTARIDEGLEVDPAPPYLLDAPAFGPLKDVYNLWKT